MATKNQGPSEDTKMIVTVLLLLFAMPVGVIVMWFWTDWPQWAKIVITLLLLLPVIFFWSIFSAFFLTMVGGYFTGAIPLPSPSPTGWAIP